MDSMTEEEKQVVEELKRRTINDLSPKTLEDAAVFYRFAKARDFNIVAAEAMLRKHIAWRKEYEIDTILTEYEPPEALVKYGSSSFVCFDKEGGVVRLQDWGRADAKGMTKIATKRELAKFWFYCAELDKEKIVKTGGNFSKPVFQIVYDLDEQTYANAMNVKCLQYLLHGIKLLLDNYPEITKRIYIINAPFYFSWIYAAMKKILPSTVAAKFQVFGSDGFQEALLKDIDADDLPAYLGGSKTDPDGNPLCETIIQRGKPIPKSYYILFNAKILIHASDAENITVKSLSQEEITFETKEENSYFEWEIEVKNRDIDFSLEYRGEYGDDSESEVLIPKQRIDSSSETEKGCIKCEKIGKYTMIFDNSYSWIHPKEVYYRFRIRNTKKTEY